MTLEQASNDLVYPFNGMIGETTPFHVLKEPKTRITTPSILFIVKEPLKDIKTFYKATLVRNPSHFLEDNPKFLDSGSHVGIIACLLCESAKLPAEIPAEFNKLKALLGTLT